MLVGDLVRITLDLSAIPKAWRPLRSSASSVC
jgi:hypothetical protein